MISINLQFYFHWAIQIKVDLLIILLHMKYRTSNMSTNYRGFLNFNLKLSSLLWTLDTKYNETIKKNCSSKITFESSPCFNFPSIPVKPDFQMIITKAIKNNLFQLQFYHQMNSNRYRIRVEINFYYNSRELVSWPRRKNKSDSFNAIMIDGRNREKKKTPNQQASRGTADSRFPSNNNPWKENYAR